jgi:hypothetical protein
MTNRRTRGQVEATEDQRVSCQSLKNTRKFKEPVHAGKKCIHPRHDKRRGITLEPFARSSIVRSYYDNRR